MTTTDINHRTGRPGPYMLRTRLMGTALLMASLGACSDKSLLIANPNAPTITGAASDPAAFQLQATGLLTQYRATRTGYINDMGRFGRESYVFTPQEPRNTSHYFIGISVGGIQQLDPSGFASGQWAGQYTNLRDIFNFKNAVPVNASLNAAQKAAALGFAKTIEAAELLEVIATRDTLGAITEIKANPAELAPFVSRDSVYKYILATLDGAATNLAAGGSSFPFALHSGFTGFNTPATFALF
ncbi:MAG TPA: hypothetical protein VHE78_19940, partial [Gemmatimonadaceae bacterium]|nr:hypothetical protein [Gemmatimonadaceae bacterium]